MSWRPTTSGESVTWRDAADRHELQMVQLLANKLPPLPRTHLAHAKSYSTVDRAHVLTGAMPQTARSHGQPQQQPVHRPDSATRRQRGVTMDAHTLAVMLEHRTPYASRKLSVLNRHLPSSASSSNSASYAASLSSRGHPEDVLVDPAGIVTVVNDRAVVVAGPDQLLLSMTSVNADVDEEQAHDDDQHPHHRRRRWSLPSLAMRPRLENATRVPKELFHDAMDRLRSMALKWREQAADTAQHRGVFPQMSYALAVPFTAFVVDEHGRRGLPVILALLRAEIKESGLEDDSLFRIELTYGDSTWSIYRSMVDLLKLHSLLKFRHLQGRLPSLPRFPVGQWHYAVDRVTTRFSLLSTSTGDNLTPELRRARAALHRCQNLEAYLQRLFRTCNLRTCHELYAFLELSRATIRRDVGVKGKEGYLKKRNGDKQRLRGALCFLRLNSWHTKWVIVRDSFIAYFDRLEDEHPSDVFLLDQHTKLRDESERQHAHMPRIRHRVVLQNQMRLLTLKPDSERLAIEWRTDIKHILDTSLWCQPHRFDSFAPERQSAQAKWFVDAKDYFESVASAIESAQHTIYIQGWWLTPELYLRRPAAQHPNSRLDRLLARRARDGVKIFIVIYKELQFSLGISSQHTKAALTSLHSNISIVRFPDHAAPGGTVYWAIHDKIVVIDEIMAYVGGIDLCLGRFDSNAHHVGDFEESEAEIWPGMDYSNPRIADFRNVELHAESLIDRTQQPRMPWHDIHGMVTGLPARDVARHFVQRWNYIKQLKARERTDIPMLMPPSELPMQELEQRGLMGTCRVQILRSAAMWSMGIVKERSLYHAYHDLINSAEHFIYIENQFFVSRADDEKETASYPIKNQIAHWLCQRIIRAHNAGLPFRVYVVLPLLPAFENEVGDQGGATIRLIVHWQAMSIARGESSIYAVLNKHGIDPNDYISFSSLRQHGPVKRSSPDDVLATEQIYVHSKLLIVDDRRVIIGSANINDRSMMGSRDGETAMLIEDMDMMRAPMNGVSVPVSKFAHTLRMRLFREHLGVQDYEHDLIVRLRDPVCDQVYAGMWRETAARNTVLYRNRFRCLPDNTVSTWSEYESFHQHGPVGTDELPAADFCEVRGNLVVYPLGFLSKESLNSVFPAKEFMLPLDVFT